MCSLAKLLIVNARRACQLVWESMVTQEMGGLRSFAAGHSYGYR